jgi:hypothetical protein
MPRKGVPTAPAPCLHLRPNDVKLRVPPDAYGFATPSFAPHHVLLHSYYDDFGCRKMLLIKHL